MTDTGTGSDDRDLDVAIVGAGAAGTSLGHRLIQARPDWRISIFERSGRVGGRLWSMHVDGLGHPIELGGMRYISGHPLMSAVVAELGLETRPFDPLGRPERTFLRGIIGAGPGDPEAGRGYDLPPEERGRSALELLTGAFLQIVPSARGLDVAGWQRVRGAATYRGRPVTSWSTGDAIATVLSPEGHRFAVDAFGYDSGVRPFNIADAIPYLMGPGDPTGEARVPVDGMDTIPRELGRRFEAAGGSIALRRDVVGIAIDDGRIALRFADRSAVRARRLVLALPVPALQALAAASPVIDGPTWRRLYRSVEGFPATKLYSWYDQPWWRDGAGAPTGLRTTTDLPLRKTFYFDHGLNGPAAILASYTDGRHAGAIVALADGRSGGAPASADLMGATHGWLAAAHPAAVVPTPTGSAFQHWGSDERECGWHFWRAGDNSDELIELAAHPDATLPIHLCGEAFSRGQGWVEGALETAAGLADRLLVAT